MTAHAQAAGRARGWPGGASAALVLSLAVAAADVRAELWSIENTLGSRYEWNDNINLSLTSPGAVNSLYLSTSLSAARLTENSGTRLIAAVTSVRQRGPGAQDRFDGQFALSQTYNDPLNTFSGSLSYVKDFNNAVRTADVALGYGQRRTTSISASWVRALSERLNANAQLSVSGSAYGQGIPGASDFRYPTLSAGTSYLLSDRDTLTLQGSRSNYRPSQGTDRASSESLSLGLSRVISERSNASLSFGPYRTDTSLQGDRLACPLSPVYCRTGLVPYTVVSETVRVVGHGVQYTAGLAYQVAEVTGLSFGASSQQTPSGVGRVLRTDTLNMAVNHAFSETMSGSIAYARSSATSLAGTEGRSVQQSFSGSLSKRLAPDLNLAAGYQLNRLGRNDVNATVRSNSVSLTLAYEWPKASAFH